MTDQNTFMEVVNNVAEIVHTSEKELSREEIFEYFSDMELDENQKQMILEYLTNKAMEEENSSELEDGIKQEENLEEIDETESKNSLVFKMYLEDLANLPQYTEEEKKQFYNELLEGNEKMIEILSNIWLEKVLEIAGKYVEPKLNVEDLVQEGNVALFIKLQEILGTQSKVDVENELMQAVETGIMKYASEMSGERELENSILAKVSLVDQAQKLLKEEKGYMPSVEELSDYTKISTEELEDLLDIIKNTTKE